MASHSLLRFHPLLFSCKDSSQRPEGHAESVSSMALHNHISQDSSPKSTQIHRCQCLGLEHTFVFCLFLHNILFVALPSSICPAIYTQHFFKCLILENLEYGFKLLEPRMANALYSSKAKQEAEDYWTQECSSHSASHCSISSGLSSQTQLFYGAWI